MSKLPVRRDPDAPWRPPDDALGHPLLPRSPLPRVDVRSSPFTVAVVTVGGVLVDEWTAFTSVLRLWPDTHVMHVGHAAGTVSGAGGSVLASDRFADVDHADVVIVPGSLGVERHCSDQTLADWLRTVTPSACWLLCSSTGTVVVAAAGLLDGQIAATSWLAKSLLQQHGATPSPDRLHVGDGGVVTCGGAVSAFEAALFVTAVEFGDQHAAETRAELVRPGARRRAAPRRGGRRRAAVVAG